MARIYIETTVISFYYNARTGPEMISRQNWSRRWLDEALQTSDDLVTSLAVENELNGGDFPNKSEMLELVSRFPLLDLNDSVAGILGLGNPALVTPLELLNEDIIDG